MAEENPSAGDAVTEQDIASNNHSAVEEVSKENEQDENKGKEEGTKTVPYYKLFSFANSVDYMLMSTGTISAVGNGLCTPLMTVVMGDMINSFGETRNNKEVANAVSKVMTSTTVTKTYSVISVNNICISLVSPEFVSTNLNSTKKKKNSFSLFSA